MTRRRLIRTWQEGEVGLSGTRRVLEGGIIEVGGSRGSKHITQNRRYHHPRLEHYVGKVVYFHDGDRMDNALSVHEAVFHKSRRVFTGKWIAYASPIE